MEHDRYTLAQLQLARLLGWEDLRVRRMAIVGTDPKGRQSATVPRWMEPEASQSLQAVHCVSVRFDKGTDDWMITASAYRFGSVVLDCATHLTLERAMRYAIIQAVIHKVERIMEV